MRKQSNMHYEHEEFVSALAVRIKKLRQERGWTQMQMMRDFGYHLSHWQNIENGRKMSLETMLRVANTFDISLEDLLAGARVTRKKGVGFGSKGYHLQVDEVQTSKQAKPKRNYMKR